MRVSWLSIPCRKVSEGAAQANEYGQVFAVAEAN